MARRPVLAVATVLSCLSAACATTGTGDGPQHRGTSVNVAWEVLDIGHVRSADGRRLRWSYTILPRNGGDTTIEVERMEASIIAFGSGDVIGGTPNSRPLRRTIRGGSETRIGDSEDWGWTDSSNRMFGASETLRPIVAVRRFFGKDVTGKSVEIEVQVTLDRGVGRLSKPPGPPDSLPPPKLLQAPDVAALVGRWRGSYRGEKSVLDIPLEVTVTSDGTFQAAENEPVTNRFSGRLRVEDGKLQYSQRRDTGFLTLREAGGKDILVGQVSGSRDDGSTARYRIYLERPASPAATSRI